MDLSLRYAFVHAKSAKVSPKHMSMRSGRRCEAGLLWQAAPASSPMLAEIKSAKSATVLPWPVIHVDIQVNDDIDQASPIRLINYLIDAAENWSIT